MKLTRYNSQSGNRLMPFRDQTPWSGLEAQINDFFENAFSDFGGSAFEHRFPVDLYEDKENTYVRAELPGLTRDDINIEMVDGYLNIHGTRRSTDDDGQVTESVSLDRSIAVPDSIAADQISARHEDGVLTITLPKREEAKPRRVTIDVK